MLAGLLPGRAKGEGFPANRQPSKVNAQHPTELNQLERLVDNNKKKADAKVVMADLTVVYSGEEIVSLVNPEGFGEADLHSGEFLLEGH